MLGGDWDSAWRKYLKRRVVGRAGEAVDKGGLFHLPEVFPVDPEDQKKDGKKQQYNGRDDEEGLRNIRIRLLGDQIGRDQGKQHPVITVQLVIGEDQLRAVHRRKGERAVLAVFHILLHLLDRANGILIPGLLRKDILQLQKRGQFCRGDDYLSAGVDDAGQASP